ncbi:MAG TPA: hypothetical protein VLA14_10955 [Polyangia bacterium]|nr:hypothetical protein [Polyangia bacterium]
MRFSGLEICALAIAVGGCAAHHSTLATPATPVAALSPVSGVWDGVNRTTIDAGMGAGDTRIEKQEWHLTQSGDVIAGYYIAALTFVSGDGRPYVCSREPQFSTVERFDVSGRVRAGAIELDEVTQRAAQSRCDPGARPLSHYSGQLKGDVLTLDSDGAHETLYRNHAPGDAPPPELALANAPAESPFPSLSDGPAPLQSLQPVDVSGLWVWEHRGAAPGGDDKQEREEWHVTQDGARLSGYYDRVVRQVSVDGHAYRCSMSLDFQIATRYQITGEVRGNQIVIYESSFEVLDPSSCDNGKRRLDAYEGQASPDELRLVWGVGGQILHRARPDVPTQRF